MAVEIEPLSPTDRCDWDEFTRFMLENTFPFHVNPSPTREEIESRKADGGFAPPEHALLAVRVGGGLVGVVGLDDLDGDAPLFDIRLADGVRGRGWGRKTVRELVRHLFDTYPRITRVEAQTRDDNIAMRRVLLHNGFVKEAHYRRTWPVAGGSPRDSVAYGLLRSDFETGRTTPLVWDDLQA
ncbi:GNAT family N-acetyltransferase [Arachnia propionica]|uniref:GNAT family N-acetyltransferase n=1 Tax=Arachnia propionica TaxID=1750 RepID=UPI00242AEA88|nr:GNAT family N-acetyltransferase [Arachnia propionica]